MINKYIIVLLEIGMFDVKFWKAQGILLFALIYKLKAKIFGIIFSHYFTNKVMFLNKELFWPAVSLLNSLSLLIIDIKTKLMY